MALNLLPSRVPIGYLNNDPRMPIYASTELTRALNELVNRVGGTLGDLGEDTFSSVFGQFTEEMQDTGDIVMQAQEFEPALESIIAQPASTDFLADMVIQPPSWGGNIEDVTVGASPYAYTAHSEGVLSVAGGTVSAFTTITRGADTITTGQMDGLFPLLAGDVATVTYTAAPTIKFIPR